VANASWAAAWARSAALSASRPPLVPTLAWPALAGVGALLVFGGAPTPASSGASPGAPSQPWQASAALWASSPATAGTEVRAAYGLAARLSAACWGAACPPQRAAAAGVGPRAAWSGLPAGWAARAQATSQLGLAGAAAPALAKRHRSGLGLVGDAAAGGVAEGFQLQAAHRLAATMLSGGHAPSRGSRLASLLQGASCASLLPPRREHPARLSPRPAEAGLGTLARGSLGLAAPANPGLWAGGVGAPTPAAAGLGRPHTASGVGRPGPTAVGALFSAPRSRAAAPETCVPGL